MEPPIIVAIVTGICSILIAIGSFYWTKKKERDADWRKQKLEHYREFLDALSGIVGTDSTPDGQKRWTRACNTLVLVASQAVIAALMQYQQTTARNNPNSSHEEHDQSLNKLILAIRKDLDISPADDPEVFNFQLWCSGTNETQTI